MSEPKVTGRMKVPHVMPFRPTAVIAPTISTTVSVINPQRDFVVTHWKFTSVWVGIPLRPMRFRIAIRDVGAQQDFQLAPFDSMALGDETQPPFKLPVDWRIIGNRNIEIQFTNIDVIATTPEFQFIGYLD